MNKVVARYLDGRILKGETADFTPAKDQFHLYVAAPAVETNPILVRVGDLKALFFVKDLAGDPYYSERKEFDPSRPPVGRRIRVRFMDGEVLLGTTQGYQPGRPGFFLVPADPASNTERCYVVAKSAQEIVYL